MGTKNDHVRRSASVAACIKRRGKASPHPASADGRARCFRTCLRVWKHYAWLEGALSPVLVTPLVRGAKAKKTVILCASLILSNVDKSLPCQASDVKHHPHQFVPVAARNQPALSEGMQVHSTDRDGHYPVNDQGWIKQTHSSQSHHRKDTFKARMPQLKHGAFAPSTSLQTVSHVVYLKEHMFLI